MRYLRSAVEAIGMRTRVRRTSRVYETRAVGSADALFLNAALVAETILPPLDLLGQLLDIEAALGRVRSDGAGDRVIDLTSGFLAQVQIESTQTKMNKIEFYEDKNFIQGETVRIIDSDIFGYVTHRHHSILGVSGADYNIAVVRKVHEFKTPVYVPFPGEEIPPDGMIGFDDTVEVVPDFYFTPAFTVGQKFDTDNKDYKLIIVKQPQSPTDNYEYLMMNQSHFHKITTPEHTSAAEKTLLAWKKAGIIRKFTPFKSTSEPKPTAKPFRVANLTKKGTIPDQTDLEKPVRGGGRTILTTGDLTQKTEQDAYHIFDLSHSRVNVHQEWDWESVMYNYYLIALTISEEQAFANLTQEEEKDANLIVFDTFQDFIDRYLIYDKTRDPEERSQLLNQLVLGSTAETNALLTGSYRHMLISYQLGGLTLATRFPD